MPPSLLTGGRWETQWEDYNGNIITVTATASTLTQTTLTRGLLDVKHHCRKIRYINPRSPVKEARNSWRAWWKHAVKCSRILVRKHPSVLETPSNCSTPQLCGTHRHPTYKKERDRHTHTHTIILEPYRIRVRVLVLEAMLAGPVEQKIDSMAETVNCPTGEQNRSCS